MHLTAVAPEIVSAICLACWELMFFSMMFIIEKKIIRFKACNGGAV